jgi:hypothetical protein
VAQVIAAALWEVGAAWATEAAIAFAANAAFINTALLAAASYQHGAEQRRRMRNTARDAFNASLTDRQTTIRSAVQPRGVLYGRDKVGGQLADAFVTGSLGQYLHLVIAFYGHECDACEKIYLNNIELPAADSNGFIQSGVYCKTITSPGMETTSSGSIALAHTPSLITSVTRTDGNSTVDYTVAGTGYTLLGNTVTFTDGALGSGSFYTVNYEWQQQAPRVRVKVHLGQAGQVADPDLVAESGGRWTSNDIGFGVTYIYFRLEYDQDIFGQIGVPEPTALWRGKKVFDPRSSTTAWSDNWALCVRDWLRDATHGLGCTSTEVPDSEINTAANISDEEVTLYNSGTVNVTLGSTLVVGSGTAWISKAYPGLLFRGPDTFRYVVTAVTDDTHLQISQTAAGPGDLPTGGGYVSGSTSGGSYSLTQRRYTVNGTLGTEDSPLSNLRRLLAAGAGTATWVQGRWLVRAGAYLTPTTTMTEDHLGTGAVEIIPRASRRDQCNRVSGKYLDAAALYAEKQYPPQSNASYKAADGGQELTREVDWWGVTDSYRAQRLAKIELERSRQAMQVTLQCNHRAYDYAPSDTANVSLARYGWGPKVFELRSRKYTPGAGIAYIGKETAASVYQWNLGDATLYSAAGATSLPNPFAAPAQLTGLACDSGATVNAQLANTLVVRGLVTWTQSTDVFVRQGGRIEVEWKLWNDTGWQKAQSVPGDSSSTYISPLQPKSVTLVRVRPINAAGRAGPWSTVAHSVQSGGALGGGNLIRNSSFEVDSDGNGLADDWIFSTNGTVGTATLIHSPDGVYAGVKAQRINLTNLGATSSDSAYVYQTVSVPSAAGRPYTASAYFVSDLNVTEVNVRIECWNTGLTTLLGVQNSVQTLAGHMRVVNTMTAPSGTANIVLLLEARKAASAGPARIYIDAAQLEPGAVPTGYAPRADELLANVVTIEHTQEEVLGRSISGTQGDTTVTERMHIPDGFGFNDIVCSTASFVASAPGVALVTYEGSFSCTPADYVQFSVQNASGTYDGVLKEASCDVAGATISISQTKQFTLVQGNTYQFKAYMAKLGTNTVTARFNTITVDVRYTK